MESHGPQNHMEDGKEMGREQGKGKGERAMMEQIRTTSMYVLYIYIHVKCDDNALSCTRFHVQKQGSRDVVLIISLIEEHVLRCIAVVQFCPLDWIRHGLIQSGSMLCVLYLCDIVVHVASSESSRISSSY